MSQTDAGLLPPHTDEHGTTWYPVRHALGGIVCSLTPESQKLWQDYADKQSARLLEMLKKRRNLGS